MLHLVQQCFKINNQVMVLVASETGHVYTYATKKFQPVLNSTPGRKLIQTCLAGDNASIEEEKFDPDIEITGNESISGIH